MPSPPDTDTGRTWRRNAGWLSAATVLISAANYGYSLAVVRLLKPADFSAFATGQSVLLVLGNGSMAAIPWAVAKYVAVEKGPYARAEALRFGFSASAVQAVAAAVFAELVLFGVSGPAVATMTAAGAGVLSLIAAPVGYLQGTDRVDTLARFRLLEAAARIGAGLLTLLLISRTAAAGLVGFPVGGATMLLLGVWASRKAWPLRKPDVAASGQLIRQSLQLGAVQLLLCALGALDTVEAAASGFTDGVSGGYQAAALLGRLPLFISTAVAIAVYTELTRAPNERAVGRHVRQLLRFYSVLAVPVGVASWTVPAAVLSLLIPDSYSSAGLLLKYTSLSGLAIGLVNCLTTAHQARGRCRSAITILVVAAAAQPILLISLGRHFGVAAFAKGLVGLSLAALVAVVWDGRRWLTWPSWRLTKWHALTLAFAILAAIVDNPIGWILVMISLTLCMAAMAKNSASPTVDGGIDGPAGGGPSTPGPAGPPRLAASPQGDSVIVQQGSPEADQSLPAGLRLLIIGGSTAAGLGTRGRSFATWVAESLPGCETLDLSLTGRMIDEHLNFETEIRTFAPDITLICAGVSESMIHPGPIAQSLIERFAPASWHGVSGLQARPYYSTQPAKRARQRAVSELKVAVKRVVITVTKGRSRMTPEAFGGHLTELLLLLKDVQCPTIVVDLWKIDDRLFPGTGKAFQLASDQVHASVGRASFGSLIMLRDVMNYWDDFLDDRLHWNAAGHRHVADLVIQAIAGLAAAGQWGDGTSSQSPNTAAVSP